jgi:hypothetical protein
MLSLGFGTINLQKKVQGDKPTALHDVSMASGFCDAFQRELLNNKFIMPE